MKFSKLYIDLIVDIEIKHDRDLDDPDNFNDSNDFDDSDDSGDSGDSESDDSQSSVSNTSVSEERSDRTPTFDLISDLNDFSYLCSTAVMKNKEFNRN